MFRQTMSGAISPRQHPRKSREAWKQSRESGPSRGQGWRPEPRGPGRAAASLDSTFVQITERSPFLLAHAALARMLGLARGVWSGLQPSPASLFELNSHCTWSSGQTKILSPRGEGAPPESGVCSRAKKKHHSKQMGRDLGRGWSQQPHRPRAKHVPCPFLVTERDLGQFSPWTPKEWNTVGQILGHQ